MLKFSCLLMLLIARIGAQTVEGTVIDSISGRGIAGVNVILRPASRDRPYDAVSDTQGSFTFEHVKAGAYGFGCLSDDYLSDDPSPHLLQVIENATAIKVECHLISLPRIAGRVADANGDGVANAQLELSGQTIKEKPHTDSSGNFEARTRPGSYILSVLPVSLGLPSPEPGGDGSLAWTRIYYPGVAEPRLASKISLLPGSNVGGIEIKLRPVPAHAIRGLLLTPDGTAAGKVAVTLGEDAQDTPLLRTESGSDGSFEFPQVADGEWYLAAGMETGQAKLRGTKWIEVAGQDIDGLKLRLAAPFSVSGRVVIEVPAGARSPQPALVAVIPRVSRVRGESRISRLVLDPELNAVVAGTAPAVVALNKTKETVRTAALEGEGAVIALPDIDGNFTLRGVYPGSYRILPLAPPAQYYLDAIQVDQANLTSEEVEFSSSTSAVTLVYKTNGGSLRGKVENCASGAVLLVPQDTTIRRLEFFRSAHCDSNDAYEVAELRPGDYYAIAFARAGIPPA